MRNFDKAVLRIDESLRDWFKPHTDKRTGKRFKGWVNCRTGGPCSSKSKGGKYPVCRPTHAQCKPIKHKMHKKKGHARVLNVLITVSPFFKLIENKPLGSTLRSRPPGTCERID